MEGLDDLEFLSGVPGRTTVSRPSGAQGSACPTATGRPTSAFLPTHFRGAGGFLLRGGGGGERTAPCIRWPLLDPEELVEEFRSIVAGPQGWVSANVLRTGSVR